jgi:hypothetical protein
VGKDHPNRESCREVLRRIEADDLTGRRGIKSILSTDHHFDDLPEITRLNPIELVG